MKAIAVMLVIAWSTAAAADAIYDAPRPPQRELVIDHASGQRIPIAGACGPDVYQLLAHNARMISSVRVADDAIVATLTTGKELRSNRTLGDRGFFDLTTALSIFVHVDLEHHRVTIAVISRFHQPCGEKWSSDARAR